MAYPPTASPHLVPPAGGPFPPPQPSLLELLSGLGTTVRDRYYKGQTLNLDGYTFVNCCFHNCTLHTQTGVFAIQDCTVAGCTIVFGQNAVRIIKLYNCLEKAKVPAAVFSPHVGGDGAVTIE